MMQILGTFDFGADQEVDVDFNDNPVVNDGGTNPTITIVDSKTGEPVPGATLIVRGDTLNLKDTHNEQADSNGEVSFSVDSGGGVVQPDWRTTQETGKVKFEIIPPADSAYTDDQANEKLTIIR